MRIRDLTARHVRIPLRKAITHASHSRTDTDSLVVCCRLEDGTEGWGEGLPRAYVTGETIESAWQILRTPNLARSLGGTYSGLPDVVERLRGFRLPARPGDDRECFGNSVRCAIELSVLDAACRSAGVPLSHVTTLVPEIAPLRQSVDRVRYSGVFTAMNLRDQYVRALKLRIFGFHQVKVKVGVPGVDDRRLLQRLRRLLGSSFDLRIDANEAWTCDNLEERLSALTPFSVTSVEQPVSHAEAGGLAALRPRLGVPIMLDESLCSPVDARRAIEAGTCDLFNLRLSKCGGFLTSLLLAATAHRAGLGCQLGCQVGETGILSASGRHFATSVDGLRYVEGSFDRFLVREPLTRENLTFGWGGYAPALAGPGLGITIDRTALQRVTQAEYPLMIEA
jgi:L-Ala-D/L-Glu epimerase